MAQFGTQIEQMEHESFIGCFVFYVLFFGASEHL